VKLDPKRNILDSGQMKGSLPKAPAGKPSRRGKGNNSDMKRHRALRLPGYRRGGVLIRGGGSQKICFPPNGKNKKERVQKSKKGELGETRGRMLVVWDNRRSRRNRRRGNWKGVAAITRGSISRREGQEIEKRRRGGRWQPTHSCAGKKTGDKIL